MPTRDRAWVLPRAVRSVLDQVAGDLELVVVDDGSVDGTAALLDGIDDPRLVRVRTAGSRVSSRAQRRRGGRQRAAARLPRRRQHLVAALPRVMRAERGDAVLAYCSQHVFLCRREPGDAIAVLSRSVRSTPYNPVAFVRGVARRHLVAAA
jgi:glycosyltransferase involved in cell wall biosynthesis